MVVIVLQAEKSVLVITMINLFPVSELDNWRVINPSRWNNPSRTIYDSAILIKAEDIDHLKISSAQSLYTNLQGAAVIPNVFPL